MIFSRKRVRGIGIDHPLAKLTPSKIEDERLAELVLQLRDGSASQVTRDEVALGHVHLAIQVAGRYARLAPGKADVLVSEAIYGIVYAVNKIAERSDEHVTPWIVSCCHRFAYNYLVKDSIIAKKWLGHGRRRVKSDRSDGRVVVVVELDPRELNLKVPAYRRRPSQMLELRELIDLSAQTDEDRSVVTLRSQGYSDKEVGVQIGRSGEHVRQLRLRIQRRFEKLKSL